MRNSKSNLSVLFWPLAKKAINATIRWHHFRRHKALPSICNGSKDLRVANESNLLKEQTMQQNRSAPTAGSGRLKAGNIPAATNFAFEQIPIQSLQHIRMSLLSLCRPEVATDPKWWGGSRRILRFLRGRIGIKIFRHVYLWTNIAEIRLRRWFSEFEQESDPQIWKKKLRSRIRIQKL